MKIAILSANLGNFDSEVSHLPQDLPGGIELGWCTFRDDNFPPITGLSPRMQYRIPKLFGWEMFPGYDYYIWLDGTMTFQNKDSIKWLINGVVGNDMLVFNHPWRKTAQEETDHIEERLLKSDKYITPRYKNGLHKEQMALILKDKDFKDESLFASTVFVYKNTLRVQKALRDWWFFQSRYFTVDQIVMPYVLWKNAIRLGIVKENLFKLPYITLTSKHR